MKTPSHLVLGAVLAEIFPSLRISRRAFLVGAVVPDVPLMLVFVGVVLASLLSGVPLPASVDRFSELYFKDPFCVSAHNVFHSPASLLIAVVLAVGATRTGSRNRASALSFLAGCGLHALVDILTHHDDGPLLMWPFDWTLRYSSSVSHWDPAHFGVLFLCVEVVATAASAYWLLTRWASIDGRHIANYLVSRAGQV